MGDLLFNRGGGLNSAIPNMGTLATDVKPINTTLWGNISRGGKMASAIASKIPKVPTGTLGRVGAGIASKLPMLGTGLKVLTGPIGAALAVGSQILGAKDTNAGEDEFLAHRKEPGAYEAFLKNKPFVPNTTTAKNSEPVKVAPEVNSVTPIPPLDTHGSATVDGNRINYSDIGNPLKDSALINSTGYSMGTLPEQTNTSQGGGGTNLETLLKIIQAIQPAQSFSSRMGALNSGNTTWDMNGLDKILAAKADQRADTERVTQQTGALANLGSSAMNAEAAKAGHEMQLLGEREKNAYMAPYYASEAKRNSALAESAPLTAKADVLKALTEQSKENPVLKASLETLKGFADRGDAQGYNDYAMKISLLTGKLIPKMLVQD